VQDSVHILSTPRLQLEPWRAADIPLFVSIAQDPRVTRYINDGTPWSAEQAAAFVERQVAGYAARGYCRWKLVVKQGLAVAGFCGAELLSAIPEIEIGWWLAPEWWGQGLATEAAHCALADLRTRIGLTRIVSLARRDNLASIRVMQHIGLVFDREIDYKGQPCVLYATPAAGPRELEQSG
jgi:[ribosomal protein S5]-alanine N-acetyltransferase